MSHVYVLLIAAMASVCCYQAEADVTLSIPSLRPKPGEEVSVKCTLTAGEGFVGWFKSSDGSKVSDVPSDTVRVETNKNEYTLRFTNVKLSQAGDYECRGRTNRKTFQLQVAYDLSRVDHKQHLTIGKTQNIELGVSGFPKLTVTWKKGGVTLNPKSDPRYTLLVDGSLRINIVRIDDQGNYTFSVEQGGYKKTEGIEVYAVEPPKIEPFRIRKKYLTEGYPASFVCKATGRPTPKYKWYNPANSPISSFGNFKIKDGNLTIKSVNPLLKGVYKCEAYNEIEGDTIGKDEATVEIVEVYVAPMINPQKGDEELARGADFTLKCEATGTPPPNVVWKRNGERDPRQEQSTGKSVIKFKNIQATDAGKYTCEARNDAVDSSGKDIVASMEKNINVRSKPYIITHASPGEVHSYLGNSHPTFVTCTFGGYPVPFVKMTYGNKLVSNATTTANFSVVTDAINKFGKYHCFAKNIYGSMNQTVDLKVVGKPGLVRDFDAVPSCKSVKLTWKLPLEDGGMPINKYVLQYKGSTRNIDSSKTETTITGLERNTDYSFIIRATNKGEWGDVTSKQVKTTKYCVPGRPVIYEPESMEIDTTSLILKWRRPDYTGGDDNIEYKVRYRDETDADKPGKWKEITTKKLEYEIKDLENQKRYKVEVRAKNTEGEGSPDERFYETSKVLVARSSQSFLVASFLLTLAVGILHLL